MYRFKLGKIFKISLSYARLVFTKFFTCKHENGGFSTEKLNKNSTTYIIICLHSKNREIRTIKSFKTIRYVINIYKEHSSFKRLIVDTFIVFAILGLFTFLSENIKITSMLFNKLSGYFALRFHYFNLHDFNLILFLATLSVDRTLFLEVKVPSATTKCI